MPAPSTNYPAILQQVMQADKFRLTKRWQKLTDKVAGSAAEKWQREAQESAELRAGRAASIPDLSYDPELPITAHREEIVALLKQRQVTVVCGETGSGKSTQLPKLCLEAGLGASGMIGHTQPRRLAARAISNRLADEMRTKVGDLVGFKIRFADQTKPQTLVKLMTDGVLLAETQSDRFLDRYDALIIDEAHERSLNIDFLLGILRRVLVKRPDLRLVITSATIDPERFAKHFADEQGPAPIVEVSGRTYPVEVRYRELANEGFDSDEEQLLRSLADAVDELSAEGPGDILTFLPTERDIRLASKHLKGHLLRQGLDKSTEILPLYARLSNAEQNKVFQSHARRRIVLSTNVAESSLTVPGIRYVIDTGLVRISRYAPRSKVKRLPIEDISQASANQRSGRCGRLGPGICIRLFEEDDFAKRPKFTTPEIRRSDLASVLLQSHVLRLGPLEEFPLLDAPGAEALRDARRTLEELGAIDEDNRLTKIGRQLGGLPCDPRVGRILLEGDARNCLAEVTIIAAAIECQDVRQRPSGQRDEADQAHVKFQDPFSDFLSYIRLWNHYEKLRNDLGRSRLRKTIRKDYLSDQGFREWSDTVRQLRELLKSAGIKSGKVKIQLESVDPTVFERPNRDRAKQQNKSQDPSPRQKLKRPEGYAEIHQALLTGLLSGIAQKGERHEYKAARGLEVALWPGSGLFQRQPKWIVAGEIVETSRRYARCVAEVDVEWIEQAGKSLLKHSYSDPHWSRKAGSAMVYRRSTLFGLPVVAGRRVAYAPIDSAAARQMLIEHGLVAGDWNFNASFYEHNCELIEDMHELAQRTRSREFIVDRFHLGNFYNQHLPDEVHDFNSLRNWLKKNRNSPAEKALRLQPEDLLPENSRFSDVAEEFPNELRVGHSEFPLQYHFEPGNQSDGIVATIPQAALRQVGQESLGWLVPGMLEEKILHLIRALPKSLRTNFVPAPDIARKLTQALSEVPRNRPFSEALCEAMREHSGEKIRSSDFQLDKLPPHLQFLVRVVDDAGEVIEESRDIESLQTKYALAEQGAVAAAIADSKSSMQSEDWTDQTVSPQQFPEIPEQVLTERGGVLVAMFPALMDIGDRVELRLADTAAEAEQLSASGATRLFAIKHNRSLRSQVSHLPNLDQAALKLSHLVSAKELRGELQDLIARVALVDDQPMLKSAIDFEARNAGASRQISIATQEISTWLPKFADEVQALRLKLEKFPQTWTEVKQSIKQQLNHLLPAGFLRCIPWAALAEYPRYLKAIQMRIEKLSGGGLPKDRRLQEPILTAWESYENLRESVQSPQRAQQLQQLRWLIEEFRVSVFAQKLGTKQTVSQKRITEFIQQLTQ